MMVTSLIINNMEKCSRFWTNSNEHKMFKLLLRNRDRIINKNLDLKIKSKIAEAYEYQKPVIIPCKGCNEETEILPFVGWKRNC